MSSPFSAGFAGGFAGTIFTSTFGDLLLPAHRAIRQFANTEMRNELPDVGAIINCYNRGLLSDGLTQTVCGELGVVFPQMDANGYPYLNSLWKAVAQSHLNVPSSSDVVRSRIQGLISDGLYNEMIKRSGGDKFSYSVLKPFYSSWMDESQLFTARNRKIITPDQFGIGLRRLGLDHDRLPEVYDTLRNALPQTGEILRYAAIGVLDDTFSQAMGLYDELPNGINDLFSANGHNRISDAIPGINLNIANRSLAEVAWAAHWSTLGVGVVNEMLHRFRADRVARYGADGLNVNEFTTQDARVWMKRNSIPPAMIDATIAAGYRPLDRRVLMVGFQTGEVQDNEARDILLDSGLNSRDADRFVDILHARVDYANAAPIRAIEHHAIAHTFQAASQSYRIGIIDRNAFITALTDMGVRADSASIHANAIDAELLAKRVEAVLKAIKRDYLGGTMDPFELSSILSQSGIAVDRQQQYIIEWQALRTLERRTASTEKILSWYVQGILTQDVAFLRLKNLGWSDVENLAHIAEASLKIAKREAAIQQAGFRNAKANAAQIDRLKRQAEQQVLQHQAELRRLTPVGRLIKWYRQGTISEVYFENRLRSMGFPDEQIHEYFIEAQKDGTIASKQ
jgi:hypothetical protein